MKFNCRSCGQKLEIAKESSYSQITCPECTGTTVVPAPKGSKTRLAELAVMTAIAMTTAAWSLGAKRADARINSAPAESMPQTTAQMAALARNGTSSASAQENPKAKQTPGLTTKDVLSIQHGKFFLAGRPFAEISFNKFDLLWELYDELAAGRSLTSTNQMVRAQDKALRNLHELGFQSIRIFALPWGPSGPESYADPTKRRNLYAALDKMVELCETHDIRVVWSLGADTFTDKKLNPQGGWLYGEEQLRELLGNPASRSRELLYRYIDETVARYRHSKTVLMWEISNEVTLNADIGDAKGMYNGERMPTLKQVAEFFHDVAERIKSVDPLRLVNSGGSNMRVAQWHLYLNLGWKTDTFDDQYKCFDLLYAKSAIDVIDIHSYPNNQPGYPILGDDGQKSWLTDKDYAMIAARLGKPLMIGELGLQPASRTDKKIWDETPNYFESYGSAAAAKPWIEKTLRDVIDAEIPLTYWWCYQSDRPVDQNDRRRFDLERERNPDLVACIVDANKRLQEKLQSSH